MAGLAPAMTGEVALVRYLAFGGGIGVERCGRRAWTARNITGGDFQPYGVAGTVATQGVNNVSPSAFFSSNTMPGRVIFAHSCHCAIAIQSVIPRSCRS
jgi:hypothetical protein